MLNAPARGKTRLSPPQAGSLMLESKWEILGKREELPREGVNLKAKPPKKQKGDYFPKNPEESSMNVPKPLRAAGVTNETGKKKPP